MADAAAAASATAPSAPASQQHADDEAANVANARAVLYVVALSCTSAIVTMVFDVKPAFGSLALFCVWHVIAKGSRHDRLFAA